MAYSAGWRRANPARIAAGDGNRDRPAHLSRAERHRRSDSGAAVRLTRGRELGRALGYALATRRVARAEASPREARNTPLARRELPFLPGVRPIKSNQSRVEAGGYSGPRLPVERPVRPFIPRGNATEYREHGGPSRRYRSNACRNIHIDCRPR